MAVVLGLSSRAQTCIQTSAYGGASIPSSGSVQAVNCSYAGEYSSNTFSAIGSYTITSSISTDYFTVTDASNNVLVSGSHPLAVSIPSTGVYRIHVSTSSSCGTQSSCRNIFVARVIPPCVQTSQFPGGNVNIAGQGTTNVTGCNYAGEYSVNSFTAIGGYTVTSSVAGDFITVTDGSNNHLLSGPAPLAVVIPSTGIYRIHISTGPTCGTQSSCRSINVVGPPPPAVANDNCSGAIMLTVPSNTAGTTVGATAESPSPGSCITTLNQPGVWYSVVGNGNIFGADLCAASGWDSKIFVYSGTCGAWTCVAGNDDFGPLCSSAAASATWCSVPTTTYFILVTGYSSPSAFTVALTQTVTTQPTVAISASSSSVCPSITTTLTASGAATYSWNTSATTASIAASATASTVYTVTGRDASGCRSTTQTINVFVYPTPTISIATNTGIVCPGANFTIVPSGANTYTYVSPTASLTGASAVVSPIANTTYTVRGTSTNGCVSTSLTAGGVTLTTQPSPTLVLSANPVSVCPGFSSTVTVSGANTYTWTSPSSNAATIAVTPTATTIYTVAGTGTTVCNGVNTVTVTVLPTPVISVNSGTICSGYSINLTPSGASTYTIADATGTLSSPVSPMTTTNYTVTGTSALGCNSSPLTQAVNTIVVNASPTISAMPSNTLCLTSTFSVMPTGANTYSLNGVSTTTVGPVSPAVTTTYVVTGTGTNGCVSPAANTASLVVTIVPLPTVTAVSSSTAICIGQATAVLTAGGANTYTWSTTNTGSTAAVSPTSTAVYTVVGTATTGCNNFATVSVFVNQLPVVSISPSSTFACVAGPSTLSASGASTYAWSTGGTNNSIVVNPTVTSSYNVVGTSSVGCTTTVSQVVNVNTITINASPNSTICSGASAVLSASGAVSYTWNNNFPFQSLNVTPTSSGVYTVFAVDANNCSHSRTVSISLNPLPNVTAAPSRTSICVGESATITASGANNYTWNNGSTGNSIVVSPTINVTFSYSVTGTDANNCSAVGITTMVVNTCVGVAEHAGQDMFISVFPNPNNGDFTVKHSTQATLNIVNDLGQLVRIVELNEQNDYSVKVSGLANGIYFITDANGARLNKKVVIMK